MSGESAVAAGCRRGVKRWYSIVRLPAAFDTMAEYDRSSLHIVALPRAPRAGELLRLHARGRPRSTMSAELQQAVHRHLTRQRRERWQEVLPELNTWAARGSPNPPQSEAFYRAWDTFDDAEAAKLAQDTSAAAADEGGKKKKKKKDLWIAPSLLSAAVIYAGKLYGSVEIKIDVARLDSRLGSSQRGGLRA